MGTGKRAMAEYEDTTLKVLFWYFSSKREVACEDSRESSRSSSRAFGKATLSR